MKEKLGTSPRSHGFGSQIAAPPIKDSGAVAGAPGDHGNVESSRSLVGEEALLQMNPSGEILIALSDFTVPNDIEGRGPFSRASLPPR